MHQDYTLKHELGQGGMATVYLAVDHQFKCDVAIKILNKEFVFNENIRKRFLDEARKLYKLNHHRIIRVSRIIETEDNVAFVMEYVGGTTLKDYIEYHGKLPSNQIKNLALQMLDAISYIHTHGIIHRDIKPSNFMIDTQGSIKLLDFGIAKSNDKGTEYTQTGAHYQMGTPMYMSPEQINEASNVSPSSDLYSLGVVLWYMAMGARPYESSSLSTFQLMSKIVNEPLPETGTIFQDIISKLTEKNAGKRFQNCEQVIEALKLIDVGDNEVIQNHAIPLPGKTNKSESTVFAGFDKADKKHKEENEKKRRKKFIIIGGSVSTIILTAFIVFISASRHGVANENTKEQLSQEKTDVTPKTSNQTITADTPLIAENKKTDTVIIIREKTNTVIVNQEKNNKTQDRPSEKTGTSNNVSVVNTAQPVEIKTTENKSNSNNEVVQEEKKPSNKFRAQIKKATDKVIDKVKKITKKN